MRMTKLGLSVLTLISLSASAANDVYGTVSELITRSGENGDNSIYFRLNVIKEDSTFESCVVDGRTMTWELDLSSPVSEYQYDIIKTSYIEQLPVRIIGYDNLCSNGYVYSDKIFELSPWSWEQRLVSKETPSEL